MQIAISSETLSGRRLMVGTPMYGGQAGGLFLRSLSAAEVSMAMGSCECSAGKSCAALVLA